MAHTTPDRIPRRDLRRSETSSERPFKNPADRDKQIIKLENLQQIPNVPIRNFNFKINALYNSIYNERPNPQNADPELDLKNDKLVQYKGAIKPIRDLIFQRLPSSNAT